jgi:L-alanine-DL-glutamate epimerase-like enolase superfamily enzyme
MELRIVPRTLKLAETFTIAYASSDEEPVVGVELHHQGLVGYGEATPFDRYGETPATAIDWLERAAPLLGDDPFAFVAIEQRLAPIPGQQASRAALDAALHDLVGKICGQPTWRILGLVRFTPETTYTIGIDTIDGTADRARRAIEAGYRRLKIKVGGADDLPRLKAVREITDLPVRVDANEGWDLESARALLPQLQAMGVELVEQPFPADDLDSFRALARVSHGVPIVIDEGCHTLGDVAEIAGYADGINIKLAKSGGMREAIRMISAARALGLVVMIGCMIESSAGIAPAAQIASLCDFVDLDGHLLLAEDPFEGLGLEDGALVLSTEPGLGVSPRG